MRLAEHEAKEILRAYGIPVPSGVVIRSPDELGPRLGDFGDQMVLKAQVPVGGRGKAGGIVIAGKDEAVSRAAALFGKEIRGIPVKEILAEERLEIGKEYYLSVAVDRSSRMPLVLFAESGGVEIEAVARERPEAVRRITVSPLLPEIPPFALRDLLGGMAKELSPVANRLYRIFREKDAILAEINPLATTPKGICAADAKIIVDESALARQKLDKGRAQTGREREAEVHGFSYVDLEGDIGVIGNGAGLTMATIDLIALYGGRAANFLDVGGGADRERVKHAVQLVAGLPSVKVIVLNILGGITRCDEVAKGILEAGISQKVMVRLAGVNEDEGRALLAGKGYTMFGTMDEAVKEAVGTTR
ncbi:MAG TPA: ATP-grasp domain-containing protein [Methanomicrobiales archaeon]|nr:ATP-grasp domain-containing protein [Methanomicrobiales archaeon]